MSNTTQTSAGKRIEAERAGLTGSFANIIKEVRPAYFVSWIKAGACGISGRPSHICSIGSAVHLSVIPLFSSSFWSDRAASVANTLPSMPTLCPFFNCSDRKAGMEGVSGSISL